MRFSAALMLTFGLAASAAAQTAPAVPAGEPPAEPAITWGAELDISSRYLWHGLAYSDGMVAWPSAWVSAKGLTVDLSANFDRHYDPKWNEYDLFVGYEQAIGRLTVNGAFSRYTYREIAGDPGSTSEVIVGAAYPAGPGDVFTTHSFDVEHYAGAYYAEVGYAVERELTPRSQLIADVSIAFWSKFADKYDIPSDGPLGPATLNLAVEQKLTNGIAVRPHVTFMRLLDRTARRELGTPAVTYGVAVLFAY